MLLFYSHFQKKINLTTTEYEIECKYDFRVLSSLYPPIYTFFPLLTDNLINKVYG